MRPIKPTPLSSHPQTVPIYFILQLVALWSPPQSLANPPDPSSFAATAHLWTNSRPSADWHVPAFLPALLEQPPAVLKPRQRFIVPTLISFASVTTWPLLYLRPGSRPGALLSSTADAMPGTTGYQRKFRITNYSQHTYRLAVANFYPPTCLYCLLSPNSSLAGGIAKWPKFERHTFARLSARSNDIGGLSQCVALWLST